MLFSLSVDAVHNYNAVVIIFAVITGAVSVVIMV